jgi:hypothetical protein
MALTTQVFTVGVNFAAATSTPVAAPAANQSILIRGLCFLVNGATVLTINSQLTGMSFGPFNFAAALTNPMVLPDLMPTEEADPYYTAIAAGTALVIANSGAVQTSGYIRYSIA